MKIGAPVVELPAHVPRKYQDVWDALGQLPNGEWLPVECESSYHLRLLQAAAYAHPSLSLRTRKDGNTLYIRKRPAP